MKSPNNLLGLFCLTANDFFWIQGGQKMKRRVVVTGLGVVHSLGNDAETFWNAIKKGENGIKTLTKFDTTNYTTKVAAQIDDFDASLYMDKKEAKRMDQFTQYAVAASQQAVTMSGIDLTAIDPYRVGVIIGSGIGGMQTVFCTHDDCKYGLRSGGDQVRGQGL